MGIVLLSSRALCHNIGLISRHYVKRQAKYWAGFWNKTVPGYVMMAIGKNISKEERDELRRYLDELD